MWPKIIQGGLYYSYKEFLEGPYWKKVNEVYDHSNLPKYCFICFSDRFYLHHEDYSILGHELEKNNLRKLVAISDACHKAIHFDEEGAKVPLKREFLRERRYQLRHKYIKWKIVHFQWVSLGYELIYRIFW